MQDITTPVTKEEVEEFTRNLVTEDYTQQAKEKFSFKKVGSFYYIIDTETGRKCITEEGKTKPFRTRTVTKLMEELYKLRTAYKKHLEIQEG